jgi:hypothetical protein
MPLPGWLALPSSSSLGVDLTHVPFGPKESHPAHYENLKAMHWLLRLVLSVSLLATGCIGLLVRSGSTPLSVIDWLSAAAILAGVIIWITQDSGERQQMYWARCGGICARVADSSPSDTP